MKELLDQFVEPILTILDRDLDWETYYQENADFIESIKATIIDRISIQPDVIIKIDSPEEKRLYESLYKFAWCWAADDTGSLTQVLSDTDFTGSSIYSFGIRLKEIKPIFITTDLPDDVHNYINESLRAYLWGLDNAAILIIWSALESFLRDKAYEADPNFYLKFYDIKNGPNSTDIINVLHSNDIITTKDIEIIKRTRFIRNCIAHPSLTEVQDEINSHKMIYDTIKVIENVCLKTT